MSKNPKPKATPLWILLGLLFLVLVIAALFAYKAARAENEWWTVTLIETNYEAGTVTLQLVDFDAIVRSYNRQVDWIREQKRTTGCI